MNAVIKDMYGNFLQTNYKMSKEQCLLFQKCLAFIEKEYVIENVELQGTQHNVNSC